MTRINRRQAVAALTVVPVVATMAEAQGPLPAIRLQRPYRNTIGVAPQPLTNGPSGQGANVLGVMIQAISPGATLYWGTDSTLSTTNGMPLVDGDFRNLEIRNVSELWLVASAAGHELAIAPYR